MKILVTGDRHYGREDFMRSMFEILRSSGLQTSRATYTMDKTNEIIEGGAKGADQIARHVGHSLGYSIKVYKADWKTYGRGAGPMRMYVKVNNRVN